MKTATKTEELLTSQIDVGLFDDFEGNLQQSGSIPYCQIVNPPNLPVKDIKKLDSPYGLFITLEQAEAVEFKPDANWVPMTVTYGDAPNEVELSGYIAKQIRLVVIHQSGIEIQEKGENGWRFAGMAYEKGRLTEAASKAEQDRENYRKVNRLLVAFLDDQNQLLHAQPFQLTARGGFGGSFGIELKDFYQQVDRTYLKAARSAGKSPKGGSMDAQAHALCILKATLDFYKPEGKAPFICISDRCAPVEASNIGLTKAVKRKDRDVNLIGVALQDVLQRKTSPLGQQILAWYDEYSDFPLPNAGRDGDAHTDEPYAGEGNVSELQFFESGDIGFLLTLDDGSTQKCIAHSKVGTTFADQFVEGARFAVSGVMNGKGAIINQFELINSTQEEFDTF